MIEIDDYNADYFFENGDNWESLQYILEDYDEPSPQEKDMSYNIFTIEQAITVINEIAKINSSLSITAERANQSLQDLINIYTKHVNGE